MFAHFKCWKKGNYISVLNIDLTVASYTYICMLYVLYVLHLGH